MLTCYNSIEYVLLRHHVTYMCLNTLLLRDLAFLLFQKLGGNDKNETVWYSHTEKTRKPFSWEMVDIKGWLDPKIFHLEKKKKKRQNYQRRKVSLICTSSLFQQSVHWTHQVLTSLSILPISQDELQRSSGFPVDCSAIPPAQTAIKTIIYPCLGFCSKKKDFM